MTNGGKLFKGLNLKENMRKAIQGKIKGLVENQFEKKFVAMEEKTTEEESGKEVVEDFPTGEEVEEIIDEDNAE